MAATLTRVSVSVWLPPAAHAALAGIAAARGGVVGGVGAPRGGGRGGGPGRAGGDARAARGWRWRSYVRPGTR